MTTTGPAGTALAFDETGRGTPLVFLHGFPLDRTIWDPQRDAFAGIARVVRVDFPGCGASAPRGGVITMDDLADGVAEVLDALRIERAALAGHSLGGYAALAFARRHPQRLLGYASIGSNFFPDTEAIRATRDPLAARIEREGMAPAVESYLHRYFAPSVYREKPHLVAAVRGLMERVDPAAAAALVRGMARRPDSAPTLAALTVPVLVLGGELDDYIPPAVLRADASSARDAIVAIVPGVGHLPSLEAPQRVNEALATWLGRVR